MKKNILVLFIALVTSVLFANPTNQINNWTVEQNGDFNAEDVVSFVNNTRDADIAFGSEHIFNNASSGFTSATVLDDSKFVVAYQDTENSNYGTACVGTVSGNIITFGAEFVFNNALHYTSSVTTLDASTFVIAFMDYGNLYYGTAIVGTVSGSSISFGSEYVFNSAQSEYVSAITLDSSTIAIVYADLGNYYYGTVIVGSISGNSITYGSEYTFNTDVYAASTTKISAAALDSDKIVIAYRDIGNSYYGTAIIGEVSGTEISYGSEFVFNEANTEEVSALALNSSKFVIAYRDYGNSSFGTAIIGNVSGTDITFDSTYVFNDYITRHISTAILNTENFVIAYYNFGEGTGGTAIVASVSDTAVSFSSEFEFNSGYALGISAVTLNSSKFVVSYRDYGNSDLGTSIIGEVELSTAPQVPQNVVIETSNSNVTITWDEVPGATSYKIYSSDLPNSAFSEDLTGTFDENGWTTSITTGKKYYYISALN